MAAKLRGSGRLGLIGHLGDGGRPGAAPAAPVAAGGELAVAGRHLEEGGVHLGLLPDGLLVLGELLRRLLVAPLVMHFRREVDDLGGDGLRPVEARRHRALPVANSVAFSRNKLTLNIRNVHENWLCLSLVVVVDESVSFGAAEESNGSLANLILDPAVHGQSARAPGHDHVRQFEAQGNGRSG